MIFKMSNAALCRIIAYLPCISTIVTVLTYSSFLKCVGGTPIFEFQYPCIGTDVCYFPEEFCDSELERCMGCDGLCDGQTRKLPLGCQAFCAKGSEESSVVPSWREHQAWFFLCLAMFAIVAIVVSIVFYINWRKKPNNRPEARTPETMSLTDDTETHGDDTASEMDNTVSNQSTISSHGGGTDAFKPSYCENKLKNVSPTDSGIQYTQEGDATAKVATSVSCFDDGKSRSEARRVKLKSCDSNRVLV